MGLFGLSIVKTKKRSKPSPRSGYGFDDIDQDHATEAKRLRAEKKKLEFQLQKIEMEREIMLKRAELQDLQDELLGDDDDDDRDPLADQAMQMLLGRFLGGQNPPAASDIPVTPSAENTQQTLSDEQIKAMIEQLPMHYRLAGKAMKDDKLRELLAAQGFDEETTERGIKIFRGKQ